MISFVAGGIRRSPARYVVLVLGLAAVVCSTCVLSAVTATTRLRAEGRLSAAFRPAYDILVRPAGAATALEARHGLVRDNFLSDLFGGITLRQLAAIRRLPSIEVAPIENIGYVMASDTLEVPFTPPRSGDEEQLFRLAVRFLLPGGTENWGEQYVYVTRGERFSSSSPAEVRQTAGAGARQITVCGPQSQPSDEIKLAQSPFTQGKLPGSIDCYSEITPSKGSFPTGRVVVPVTVDFPMLLTAIDPSMEARFFGLRRALASGSYLSDSATGHLFSSGNLGPVEQLPVLASDRSFFDESVQFSSRLIAQSNDTSLAEMLASPRATAYAASLRSSRLPTVTTRSAASLYSQLLHRAAHAGPDVASLPVPEYWTVRPPSYHLVSPDTVAVTATKNSVSLWQSPPGWGETTGIGPGGQELSYSPAPPGNSSSGFEQVTVHELRPGAADSGTSGGPPVADLGIVGTFDPSRLPGGSAPLTGPSGPVVSKVPLETFTPPIAIAADAATEAAIGGRVLGPTSDLSGYIAEPPLLLTTLAAARSFFSDHRYLNSDAARPISSILVRLDGSLGTGSSSRSRIEAAALRIRQATGLAVDIMDGSSPTPVSVILAPSGRHRAALDLIEQWTKKGVTYAIASSVDATSLGLLAVALLAGLIFVGSSVAAMMRRRRNDLSVLVVLGWTWRDLVRSILGEVLAASLLASLTGVAAAIVVTVIMSIHLSAEIMALCILMGPITAVMTASVPVVGAARASAAGRFERTHRHGSVRASRSGLAWANVHAGAGRSVLAAIALAVGLASFAVLLGLDQEMSERLVDTKTILGTSVDVGVRGLDVAGAVAIVALGAAAVANALLASAHERRRAHAVLTAVGWRRGDLVALSAAEATAVCLVGEAGGVGLASLVAWQLHVPLASVAFPVAGCALGCILLVVATVTIPALRAGVGAVAATLARQER